MLMLVGEFWGKEEVAAGRPFVGFGGKALYMILAQAGISMRDAYQTCVFNLMPEPNLDPINFCGPKVEGIPGLPEFAKSKYVRSIYAGELERLEKEIRAVKPNLIFGFGSAAAWALLLTPGVRKLRGAPLMSRFGYKTLITYSPSALIKDWSLRPILLADANKAKREMMFPELRRPERFIWTQPTYQDLLNFESRYIVPSDQLSIDIETRGRQITCIGFAPSPTHAIVVPFWQAEGYPSYWPSVSEEKAAWEWVRRICALPKRTVVGQNFLYDLNHLWTNYGITVPHFSDDTMLLHHSLQPELEKGLGFLGSIYTDEASWKFMRAKHETVKKED